MTTDPLLPLRQAGLSPSGMARAVSDAFGSDAVGRFRLWLMYEAGLSRASANTASSIVRHGLSTGDIEGWASDTEDARERARRRNAAKQWARWRDHTARTCAEPVGAGAGS